MGSASPQVTMVWRPVPDPSRFQRLARLLFQADPPCGDDTESLDQGDEEAA